MRHFRLKVLIHLQPASLICFEACCLEVQEVGVRLAADCVKKSVAMNSLSALQISENPIPVGVNSYFGDCLPEPEGHPGFGQVVTQGIHDLAVYKIKKRWPLFDKRDLYV